MLHQMDEDITFSLMCVLSSVVSTSAEKDIGSRVSEGVRTKCGLHYCLAWKMSLHRGVLAV